MADKMQILDRTLTMLIAVCAAVGVVASVSGFLSYYSYKGKLRDVLNREYRTSCTVFLDSVSDKSIGADTYAALDETLAALDEISAVKIPNAEMAAEIASLVEEEKVFLTDLCRSCEIAYSGEDITSADAEWLERFTESMREDNKLYSFYRDINKLLNK